MNDPSAAVARLAGHRVLVVGDLVLDEYRIGRPSRISREAPVLVLDEVEREYRVGSAGNPAANVVALGSKAGIVGAIGADAAGQQVEQMLQQSGIDTAGLRRIEGGCTSCKMRILAEGYTGGSHGRQQVLRLDQVSPTPRDVARACAESVHQLGARYDAILLSDYRAGVIQAQTIDAARQSGRRICVDSQGDVRAFRGVELLKVNEAEARAALGSDDIMGQANALRRELEVKHLVVTLGARGMAIFTDGETRLVPAARITEVFDVTGAGDTVITVLTLGLVGGLPLVTAAELANAAAGVVVRRLGVATVSPDELTSAVREGGGRSS